MQIFSTERSPMRGSSVREPSKPYISTRTSRITHRRKRLVSHSAMACIIAVKDTGLCPQSTIRIAYNACPLLPLVVHKIPISEKQSRVGIDSKRDSARAGWAWFTARDTCSSIVSARSS
jgi:hypothetical protein